MNTKELLWKYQKAIQAIYEEQKLTCLSGLHNEYVINGKEIFIWHNEVTRKCAIKYGGHFHYMKNLDDILFCSDELLYFTASLYLYRQYINNPIEEAFRFGDGMVYPNFQNLYAKRYSMLSDVVGQKAYNYWDRIGDLIASFFPDKIESHKVFFTTALDVIPQDFKESKNYSWLMEFKETGYKELNGKRKQIVHYSTTETEYKYEHLKGSGNKEAMEKLQHEREALADFYKQHIALTLSGFEKTLLLLEEISNKLFSDVVAT